MRMSLLLVVAAITVAACDNEDYRDWERNKRIVRICATGNIIYEWRGQYWTMVAGHWNKVANLEVCMANGLLRGI